MFTWYSNKSGWEEELSIITQCQCWLIAISYQMYTLNIWGGVIEDTLSSKVIESCLFRLKLKANYSKRFSTYHTYLWEYSKSFCWVWEDLIIHRSVTCIYNLNCLIYWLINTSCSKNNLIRRTYFDHGNEWLWAWWKWVSNKSDTQTRRWIYFFIQSFFKLWFF